MFSTLFSFLSGSVFRMIWGEVSSFINKRQDHQHELEMLKLQNSLDQCQHLRQLELMKIQADIGVKTIEVQSDADVSKIESEAFLNVVNATSKNTGVLWIDAWNQSIRPCTATWALLMISLSELGLFALSDSTSNIASVALGIYLADRALAKRGK